jgi:hypothetical protein
MQTPLTATRRSPSLIVTSKQVVSIINVTTMSKLPFTLETRRTSSIDLMYSEEEEEDDEEDEDFSSLEPLNDIVQL